MSRLMKALIDYAKTDMDILYEYLLKQIQIHKTDKYI